MSRTQPVNVVGSGGHAKVVVGTARRLGFRVEAVFDDDPSAWGGKILDVPIVGPIDAIRKACGMPGVIAIGNNATRSQLARQLDLEWATLVDPLAWVEPSVELGAGCIILPGAIVQVGSRLGCHSIVNTSSSIDHDCDLGECCHVAPGCRLAGGVRLGQGVLMGIGSTAAPNSQVGDWSTVGAGATVIHNIPDHVVAVGTPAVPTELPEQRFAA